jgi:hypothetical protein
VTFAPSVAAGDVPAYSDADGDDGGPGGLAAAAAAAVCVGCATDAMPAAFVPRVSSGNDARGRM